MLGLQEKSSIVQNSVRMASAPTMISTKNLPNTILDHYLVSTTEELLDRKVEAPV
jgi:hypothetical protein